MECKSQTPEAGTGPAAVDRGKEPAKARDGIGRPVGADGAELMGHVRTLMSTLREAGAMGSL